MFSFARLVKFTFIILLLSVSSKTIADNKASTDMSLKTVMEGLLTDTKTIADGIIRENFQQIESAALQIANHPSFDLTSKKKIVQGLSFEMKIFKQFDGQVHDTAVRIKQLADKQDMKNLMIEYKNLIEQCHSCHTRFKHRVQEILKEK